MSAATSDPGRDIAPVAWMEVAQMLDGQSTYEVVNGMPVVVAPEEIDVTTTG